MIFAKGKLKMNNSDEIKKIIIDLYIILTILFLLFLSYHYFLGIKTLSYEDTPLMIISVGIELTFSILITGFFIMLVKAFNGKQKFTLYFLCLLITTNIGLISNVLYHGIGFSGYYLGSHLREAGFFCSHIVSFFIIHFFSLYILAYIEETTSVSKIIKKMLNIENGLGIMCFLIYTFIPKNLINNWKLEEHNFVYFFFIIIPLLTCFITVICFFAKTKNKKLIYFLFYPTIVIIFTVTDYTIGSNIAFVAAAYSLIQFYLQIQLDDEQKQAKNKQKQDKIANDKLKAALQIADVINTTKNSFLLAMSHHIQTYVNEISEFNEIAAKYIDDREKVLDSIDKSNSNCTHLSKMITDVIYISRLDNGKVSVNEESINLRNMMLMLASDIQFMADQKNVGFECTIAAANEMIITDRIKLNEILVRLLSNAIQFTPPDGKISFAINQLKENQNGTTTYQFTIEDNGIGMSSEYLQNIFEAFSRNSMHSANSHGSGLGMYIVKKLTNMLNGRINITSKPNAGTTVVICFDFTAE